MTDFARLPSKIIPKFLRIFIYCFCFALIFVEVHKFLDFHIRLCYNEHSISADLFGDSLIFL